MTKAKKVIDEMPSYGENTSLFSVEVLKQPDVEINRPQFYTIEGIMLAQLLILLLIFDQVRK